MTQAQDPELLRLRKAMRALDLEILERLNQRADLSAAIRKLRESGVNLASVEPGEQAWVEELLRASAGALPKESAGRIFAAIRDEARGLEQSLSVAFMGAEGGFGYELAAAYFGASAKLVAAPTTADALTQVVRGRALFAVFPLESSDEGLVQTSVTALATADLPVIAERSIAANYSLMTVEPGARIERIFLTPRAHVACEQFVLAEFAHATVVDVKSPLLAAKAAAEGGGAGCIVPEGCGKSVGLSAVRTNVSDVADLRYRYAIAGTRPAMRTGTDTTCLLFGGDDSPGALYGILSQFAERGISLKKLQSRPRDAADWDYVFYVEVAGHVSDRAVVTALEAVRRSTKYLKVLGSFPSEL